LRVLETVAHKQRLRAFGFQVLAGILPPFHFQNKESH
jgi:hypothetical protein